ncbi:SGNH hydrolase domain-containing protein [Alteromonas macleodii]|uniref:SGNH hydrolase domain-containing protein n=1 Tax=Alteromonas macleodii TaxID=28108 RepID=UPI003AA8EFC9
MVDHVSEELEDFDYQGHTVTGYLNNTRVDVIRPSEILCTDSKCKLTENLNVLYFDSNHLSVVGADLLVDSLSN